MYTERFIIPNRLKNMAIGASVLGLLLVIVGVLFIDAREDAGIRFWTNFLLGSFYFTAIAVVSILWMAIQYMANAGWSSGFKRIPEAISGYLYISAIAFIIIIIAGFVNNHSGIYALYEWLHLSKDGMIEHHGELKYDPILHGKSGYLNLTFFLIRFALYFVVWIIFREAFRRYSLKEDAEGGLRYYDKSLTLAAGAIPAFALTFCFFCYDWFMSLEPHWYSTMYAVNVFASSLVGTLSVMAIIIILMRRSGQMTWLNDSHLHDLGKFMFGFSIFWTYTWISQYMLIWYANLPEETPYFLSRMHGLWFYVFFGNLTVNFIMPFLFLMMRNSKRAGGWMLFVASVLLVGRYIDFYLLVMPGPANWSEKYNPGFGLLEIGMFLLFGGLFVFSTAYYLAKAPLAARNHPYFEESIHHDI